MKGRKVKPFEPRTAAEKQLVQLVKAMYERMQADDFSEWHAWAHRVGEKKPFKSPSPFLSFMREWAKADKKNRLPIWLAGVQAYANGIDPYIKVGMTVVPKEKASVLSRFCDDVEASGGLKPVGDVRNGVVQVSTRLAKSLARDYRMACEVLGRRPKVASYVCENCGHAFVRSALRTDGKTSRNKSRGQPYGYCTRCHGRCFYEGGRKAI